MDKKALRDRESELIKLQMDYKVKISAAKLNIKHETAKLNLLEKENDKVQQKLDKIYQKLASNNYAISLFKFQESRYIPYKDSCRVEHYMEYVLRLTVRGRSNLMEEISCLEQVRWNKYEPLTQEQVYAKIKKLIDKYDVEIFIFEEFSTDKKHALSIEKLQALGIKELYSQIYDAINERSYIKKIFTGEKQ